MPANFIPRISFAHLSIFLYFLRVKYRLPLLIRLSGATHRCLRAAYAWKRGQKGSKTLPRALLGSDRRERVKVKAYACDTCRAMQAVCSLNRKEKEVCGSSGPCALIHLQRMLVRAEISRRSRGGERA